MDFEVGKKKKKKKKGKKKILQLEVLIPHRVQALVNDLCLLGIL